DHRDVPAGRVRRPGRPGPVPGPDPGQAVGGPARPVGGDPGAARRPLPLRRGHRHPQLPGPAGPGRAAGDLRARAAGARRAARRVRQLLAGADARHARARDAHAAARGGAPLGRRGPRRLPGPGARLRPALLGVRPARHRARRRPDDARRPRHGRRRGAGRRRPGHQGHLVRAEVRQPRRHRVLRRGRAPAGRHAGGRARLPDHVGQRLRRAPPHRRGDRDRRRPGAGRRRRTRRPAVRVRVHLEDHARRGGRRLPRDLAGQPALVAGAHGEADDRPGQGQPPPPRAVLRRHRRRHRPHAAPPRADGAQVRRAGGHPHRALRRRPRGRLVEPEGRLLRHADRARGHGHRGGPAGRGGGHRADAGRRDASGGRGPAGRDHPPGAVVPAARRGREGDARRRGVRGAGARGPL
ncbi:MAG: Aspartate transaminase, partial [uncultured Pseudonocardia sp.]